MRVVATDLSPSECADVAVCEGAALEIADSPLARPELEGLQADLRDSVGKLGVRAVCDLLDAPAAAAIVRDAESIGVELVVLGMHGRTGPRETRAR